MNNDFIAKVLQTSPMLSLEQGINIHLLLTQVILMDVPGDVVELGCWGGQTSILMQKTLDLYRSKKRLHVYDSFEGLPEPHEQDQGTHFKEGWCATDEETLRKMFALHDARLPEIHPGWFSETLENELPERIAFAHLDGDFYSSIIQSLEHTYPRLAPGAIVVIDDYCDLSVHDEMVQRVLNNRYRAESERNVAHNPNALPGVKTACDKFFDDKPEDVSVLFAGIAPHAYFRKS
ncbi:MAG: class I SAM-dependent methyltransferase [Proteobacteria bacterium]|nr:class I SAM-dependent methyltransferase [Pseudomonadota bacterium]